MPLPLPTTALLALLAAAPARAGGVPSHDGRAIARHVQDVADRVTPHLPRAGRRPAIVVVERAAVTAGMVGGELEVSTGLLGALTSDAELALVLAYETARALPPAGVPPRGRAGVGERIARAAAVAAAAGLAAGAVSDQLDEAAQAARVGASAAAGAAAGTAAAAALSRRGTRQASASDDDAAADAMRAVIGAGHDGSVALGAWDALGRATPLGGTDGSYGDHGANKRRARAGRKVLERSVPLPAGTVAPAVGRDTYSRDVRAHLDAWRFAVPAPPDPAAAPAPAEGPGTSDDQGAGGAWLAYRRSGGITGWVETVRIWPDGSVEVAQSPDRGADGARLALPPADLAALREAVAAALRAPPRQGRPERGWMRDGQARTLAVSTGGGVAQVQLSDGYSLLPSDWTLIRLLEGLPRRAAGP